MTDLQSSDTSGDEMRMPNIPQAGRSPDSLSGPLHSVQSKKDEEIFQERLILL
jgi:hypothetical protein